MQNSVVRNLINTLDCYHQDLNFLLNISNKQNSLLQKRKTDRFHKSKLDKERTLEKLKQSSQKIHEFYQSWIEMDSKISQKKRLQIWKILDSILQLTHSVLTVEQENRQLIELTKADVLTQIQQFYFTKN